VNIKTILAAEKEALEFLERVKNAKTREQKNKYFFFGCGESAALRRQSLELSAALVELRKPG